MHLRKLNEQDINCLRQWHGWLDDNRGDRAQLRRAAVPDDILLTPAFAHFLQQMPNAWADQEKLPVLDMATIAAVLARVKNDIKDPKFTFARSLATPREGGSKSVMSELRFQQLQKSRIPEEFFQRVCRAVNLLGGRVNIASLADDIAHWLAERRFGPASKPEDRLAVRWASDYYAAFKE